MLQIPVWALPIADGTAAQLTLVAGGRASGKSGGIARAIISRLTTTPYLRAGVVRNYRTGAMDGALQLARRIVRTHDIDAECPRTSTRMHFGSGSELFVHGSELRSENLKELEACDIIWCEEWQTMSAYAWELLEPTVREDGASIVCSFNPTRVTDAAWQVWQSPPPYARRVWTHWSTNPWETEITKTQRGHAKQTGNVNYGHIWDGKLRLAAGSVFAPGKVNLVPELRWPDATKRVRSWDTAATDGDGDWTVGALMAFRDGAVLIEDIVRGQWGPDGVDREIKAAALRDGHDVIVREAEEPGSSGKAVTDRRARDLSGYVYHAVRDTGSKVSRADAFASGMGNGLVCVPAGSSWWPNLEGELAAFSVKESDYEHDDQVDACAGGFNELSAVRRGMRFL